MDMYSFRIVQLTSLASRDIFSLLRSRLGCLAVQKSINSLGLIKWFCWNSNEFELSGKDDCLSASLFLKSCSLLGKNQALRCYQPASVILENCYLIAFLVILTNTYTRDEDCCRQSKHRCVTKLCGVSYMFVHGDRLCEAGVCEDLQEI